jgi:hypothetical protein
MIDIDINSRRTPCMVIMSQISTLEPREQSEQFFRKPHHDAVHSFFLAQNSLCHSTIKGAALSFWRITRSRFSRIRIKYIERISIGH